ncbi:MAG: hypothetical protein RIQ60_1820 [Pseudomonadota bacterium]|jgi:hypothetical protein
MHDGSPASPSSVWRRMGVGVTRVLAALLVGLAGVWLLEQDGRVAAADALQRIARSAEHALASHLSEREREIALLSQSRQLTQARLSQPLITEALEQRQNVSPEYAWPGWASTSGEVIAATGGLLVGQSVSERPWFAAAQRQFFVSDVHKAVLMEKLLPPTAGADGVRPVAEPLRFVDIAAPVRDERGQLLGVLGAHLHWRWVSDTVEAAVLPSSDRQQIELVITDRQGEVLYPYAWAGKAAIPAEVWDAEAGRSSLWPDQQRYLTAQVGLRATSYSALGWRVLLRQPLEAAMAPVRHQQVRMLVLAGVIGLLSSAACTWASRRHRRGPRSASAENAAVQALADGDAA